MQRAGIGEIGIAAEQAIDHRADEAPFEQARCGRGFSSVSAVKNVRLIDAVGGGARVERVDDVVGLAEPERQRHHEVGADIADDVFGQLPPDRCIAPVPRS